jgi:hypothetical protein
MMAGMRTRLISPAALMLLLAAAVVSLTGCEQDAAVSAERAQEAFLVAFGSAYVGSMAAQLGQTLDGVEIRDDRTVVFDEFDVTDLETDYTSVSGTLTAADESARADLILAGGPVETIAFDLTAEQLAADDAFTATVVINGTETKVEIDASTAGD